ncbi:MAG: hypothetical protein COZ37_02720 [bacterium (Candidatus Ratteibacteria) CG_4_10_14_3_um_filter_41_18]|uniref:Transglutaminase-like domain-containing protein n=1 Tax=bacterium (Candidatus Ratteibacteria) CG_4_10_14_3_um_filter_41_18 TaxID=2014287 RepID=A0A2M7M3Z0_9BACT|nr:MAG: hypothetical protein COZ37_02720 [bacterium (Candidatus Ratteibacteria) CG_4_10_14_3_um_filter_41_18]
MAWDKKRFGYYFLLIFFFSSFSLSAEELKTYTLFSSEEPAKYLETVDYQPLKEKAAEIAKKWSNDGKKAEGIANWVGSSKDYDVGGLEKIIIGIPNLAAPEASSIAALFQSKKGVCGDAAVLTVAMLRAVGLPARILFDCKDKGNPGHAFSQVFFDRGWWAIDTTFDTNRKIFSYRQFSELEEPWFTDEPGEGKKIVVSPDFLFGTLLYPFSREIIVDGKVSALSLNLTFFGSWGSDASRMRLAGEPVLDAKTKKVAQTLYFPPHLYNLIREKKCYIKTKLPLGSYRLSYGIRTGLTGFFHEIGYINFMLMGPSVEVKINAEKLKPAPGVEKKLFTALCSVLQMK